MFAIGFVLTLVSWMLVNFFGTGPFEKNKPWERWLGLVFLVGIILMIAGVAAWAWRHLP